jgi:hypothetical protein
VAGDSPIILDLDHDGFALTSATNGVQFDINADGNTVNIGWTKPRTRDAFIALDRNGNGRIDNGSELFGNASPQEPPADHEERNGFRGLAFYDELKNGGNGDGVLSRRDSVYPRLLLWIDANHNGTSDPGELLSLADAGVSQIDLRFHVSRREDEFGNRFRYVGSVLLANGRQGRRVVATDVIFTE